VFAHGQPMLRPFRHPLAFRAEGHGHNPSHDQGAAQKPKRANRLGQKPGSEEQRRHLLALQAQRAKGGIDMAQAPAVEQGVRWRTEPAAKQPTRR